MYGEVSEWLKEHAWKVCIRSNVSRVRIPLSPPILLLKALFIQGFLLSGLPFTHQLTHHLILVVRRELVTDPTSDFRVNPQRRRADLDRLGGIPKEMQV